MAAEKKSSSSSSSSSAKSKKPAPKSKAPETRAAAPSTKTAKKPAKAHVAKQANTAPSATPLIDTSLAAQNAARMLAAGVSGKPTTPLAKAPLRQESSLFKQLKSGLNKPSSTAMNNLLDKTHGPSPHKTPAFQKQVGHNQTSGGDVTRSGVPRRTNG
jgi:hypothetical protein